MISSAEMVRATGRRKGSVARVRLAPGSGRFVINGRSLEDYFPRPVLRMLITEPLRITSSEERFDIIATLHGGGISGQAGALRHGISRAMCEFDPTMRADLKKNGMLTRDSRVKERRKYGLAKARKAKQFSKR